MIGNPRENSENDVLDVSVQEYMNLKVKQEQSENDSSGGATSRREQLNEGRWSEEDNLRFVVFIHKYQEIFNSKHQRKSCKIFKLFSEHLLNRTPAQCRSHFQKIMIKYKTIAKLKRFYRKKFGEELYNSEMERLAESTSTSIKSTEELDTQKVRKQFGVQTDENENKGCLINLPVVNQAPNYFGLLDYNEHFKMYGVNLERPLQNYYWPCYCLNNPQFI